MDYLDHSGDRFRRTARYQCVFLFLLAGLCVITVLNINIGSVPISVSEIVKILLRREGDPTQVNIIWKIRLPRHLLAASLGGSLSLSDFLLQTFFANPIAGPFVLGISSGAKMVVALTMIYFLDLSARYPPGRWYCGVCPLVAFPWGSSCCFRESSGIWRFCWWRAS